MTYKKYTPDCDVCSFQRGQGAPAREPLVGEDEQKKMMMHYYRRQEELKVSKACNASFLLIILSRSFLNVLNFVIVLSVIKFLKCCVSHRNWKRQMMTHIYSLNGQTDRL